MAGGRRRRRGPAWTAAARRFGRQVLALAARGEGQTSPNPMVGALLVRGGRVVGRGYHTRAGADHAEVVALRQAGRQARGATLYVNLEPCCHHGRTPPCTDALIGAEVRRVVAFMRDPDARVNGKGFAALKSAGIEVRIGLLEEEARRLNRRFLRHATSGRPFVTLKAGMSLDGRIATRSGISKWITSPPARRAGRTLRREHDAVLVGVRTVLADDPLLTAGRGRGDANGTGRGAAPARVVVDARLRTPPRARLFSGPGDLLIATLPGASRARRDRLERAGAVVLEVPGRNGRIDLKALCATLGRRGITSLLVEGGSEVLGTALDQKIGDRVVLFVSSRILGGRKALPVFGGLGAGRIESGPRLLEMSVRRLGTDFRIEGRLRFPRAARRTGRAAGR